MFILFKILLSLIYVGILLTLFVKNAPKRKERLNDLATWLVTLVIVTDLLVGWAFVGALSDTQIIAWGIGNTMLVLLAIFLRLVATTRLDRTIENVETDPTTFLHEPTPKP